jgi:hypothetical protein
MKKRDKKFDKLMDSLTTKEFIKYWRPQAASKKILPTAKKRVLTVEAVLKRLTIEGTVTASFKELTEKLGPPVGGSCFLFIGKWVKTNYKGNWVIPVRDVNVTGKRRLISFIEGNIETVTIIVDPSAPLFKTESDLVMFKLGGGLPA